MKRRGRREQRKRTNQMTASLGVFIRIEMACMKKSYRRISILVRIGDEEAKGTRKGVASRRGRTHSSQRSRPTRLRPQIRLGPIRRLEQILTSDHPLLSVVKTISISSCARFVLFDDGSRHSLDTHSSTTTESRVPREMRPPSIGGPAHFGHERPSRRSSSRSWSFDDRTRNELVLDDDSALIRRVY